MQPEPRVLAMNPPTGPRPGSVVFQKGPGVEGGKSLAWADSNLLIKHPNGCNCNPFMDPAAVVMLALPWLPGFSCLGGESSWLLGRRGVCVWLLLQADSSCFELVTYLPTFTFTSAAWRAKGSSLLEPTFVCIWTCELMLSKRPTMLKQVHPNKKHNTNIGRLVGFFFTSSIIALDSSPVQMSCWQQQDAN